MAPDLPARAQRSLPADAKVDEVEDRKIDAPTSKSFEFTTSDELSAPIQLQGALRIALRPGTTQVAGNCNSCGTGCQDVRDVPALFADVELPVVRGGFSRFGYAAWLGVNSDAPRLFSGPGEGTRSDGGEVNLLSFVRLRQGAAATVAVLIPQEATPYAPCFALNVWDWAGHWQAADPVCLPRLDVEAYLAAHAVAQPDDASVDDAGVGDSEPDADVSDERGAVAAEGARAAEREPAAHPSGCGLSPASSSNASQLACLTLALLFARRRFAR